MPVSGCFDYWIFPCVPAVNVTTVGFSYLLAILVASTLFELPTLIVMCIAATMAYDFYFLPPVGTLAVDSPQDWVSLCAFLLTAVLGCRISTSERNHAKEAVLRRFEVERLYTLSSRLLGAKDSVDVIEAIPKHIAESFGLESAALYFSATQRTFCSGTDLPLRGDSTPEGGSLARPSAGGSWSKPFFRPHSTRRICGGKHCALRPVTRQRDP